MGLGRCYGAGSWEGPERLDISGQSGWAGQVRAFSPPAPLCADTHAPARQGSPLPLGRGLSPGGPSGHSPSPSLDSPPAHTEKPLSRLLHSWAGPGAHTTPG